MAQSLLFREAVVQSYGVYLLKVDIYLLNSYVVVGRYLIGLLLKLSVIYLGLELLITRLLVIIRKPFT